MDVYEYIKSHYGKLFRTGMRVKFIEGVERYGIVMPPTTDSHYVRVRFDDRTYGVCHPASLNQVEKNDNRTAPVQEGEPPTLLKGGLTEGK